MLRLASFITFVLCSLSEMQLHAAVAIKSEYSYDQQGPLSFEGSETVVGDIDRIVELPNATYEFDIKSVSENVYELRSKARLEVDIDGRQIDGRSGGGWSSTKVSAFSASQLVDTTIVEGLQGQTSGTAEFVWNLTGASTITVDSKLPSDAYVVNELSTTALFNIVEDQAVPELSVNNQGSLPLGTSNVSSIVPDYFEPIVVPVDWNVGEELAVFFELQTSAQLEIMNLDAAGFEAVVDSDFSNTAALEAIRIYDSAGDLISSAFLRSTEDGFVYDPQAVGFGSDPIVPEPTTQTTWLVLLIAITANRVDSRKSRRS